jgi:hypothetical protein
VGSDSVLRRHQPGIDMGVADTGIHAGIVCPLNERNKINERNEMNEMRQTEKGRPGKAIPVRPYFCVRYPILE